MLQVPRPPVTQGSYYYLLYLPSKLRGIVGLTVTPSVAPPNTTSISTTVTPSSFQTQATIQNTTTTLSVPKTEPAGVSGDLKYPLVLFLHGRGESSVEGGGKDLNKLLVHGIPKIVERAEGLSPEEEDKRLGFIAVSPQCKMSDMWDPTLLRGLLDHALTEFSPYVDTSRLYCTGLSIGGFGTWSTAIAFPELFAALVPICGGGSPQSAALIKDIPQWVFHGEDDDVVPLKRSQEMVQALLDAGATQVRFTVYPGVKHDCWTQTYDNPELYGWLLSQKKQVQPQSYRCSLQ